MKNFNILSVYVKIWVLRGEFMKNQCIGGIAWKGSAWTVCIFKEGGTRQKRGEWCFGGVLIPWCTLWVVLVPCWAWKIVFTTISGSVNISEAPGCHLLRQMSFPWESQKITSRIGVSWTHSLPFCFDLFLTQWIMAILSKVCKPENFVSRNSLKLSFTNIQGLRLNFV